MDAAIQNLELIRQLIAEARRDSPFLDMVALRMIHDTGTGTDNLATQQEDR